jgi:GT2 family glycosyltransferase
MPAPLVSIIIPVFNKLEYTAKCLRAIAAHTRDVPHEVIVIDNASSDDTQRALARREGIRYRRNSENLGFAKASNQGAAMALGRFLLFLNNDTEPHPGWAAAMVAEMERDPAVACVGSKLLYPDGTIQHAGVGFAYAMWQPIMPMHVSSRQPAGSVTQRREVNAVTAACMLVRPEVFVAAGGFDEGYVNGYEDVDFCLEVRARGGKIVFTPASVVTHHESVTEGRFDASAANTERLMARWIDRFEERFQYDVDFRRTARAQVPAPDRPGVSVVVVADRSIWTIAPCLENLWYATGAQDEILIVDDSRGAAAGRFAARFAARHAERVRVLATAGSVGFPRAFALGLAAAARPLAALVGPNVRVAGDWLGRLVAHRRDDPTAGAITATLGDAASLTTAELLTPAGRTAADADPGGAAADDGAAGAIGAGLVPAMVATSFTLFGDTADLRELGTGDALFGADPGALARGLAGRGLALRRARDVVVYRLNEVAAGADPVLRERYLALQRPRDHVAEGDGAEPEPLASIIVVSGGDPQLTRRCLAAIRRYTDAPFEVVVVENGAHDGGSPTEAAGDVTAIRNPANEGFAFAVNQGLDCARGRLLAILHDDVLVGSGWMRRARAALAADPAIGMVGPASNECAGAQRMRMVSYGGADDAAAFTELWAAEHQGELAIVPRLAGMCLILRREVMMRIGGFDTLFGWGKGADEDFSVRAVRAGWKLAIALDVFVHHQGGAAFRRLGRDPRRVAEEGWRTFCSKWDHAASANTAGDFARLGAAPFDLARDRVPLRYTHIFCPEAPPQALACRQPIRFLCVADDLDRPAQDAGWRAVVRRFVETFTVRDPVALVVRIEPPTAGAPALALAEIAATLTRAGFAIADLPEVLFEATVLPPACRGSIYTAARVFLRTDSERDRLRAREAAACGLEIVDANATPDDLRRVLAAHRRPGAVQG